MLVGVFVLLAVTVVPAFAVTDGELDGDGHPAVVLLLMEVDGAPAFRCSGTLLAPRVLLTAGHCAGAPGEFSGMRVFTESDVQAGIGTTNNYPNPGPNSVEAVAWAAHPQYSSAQFFLHDVGVVILQAPGFVLPASEYGRLPDVNQLDSLKTRRGQQDKTFTAVGYGLQKSFPDAASWKDQASRTRYVAHPYLIQINGGIVGDYSLLLSNNAHSGGTCFGDSGGPNFIGGDSSRVVGGVTSFGLNGNCAGTGGVFRVDRQDVQNFVCSFAEANLSASELPPDC
jgi:V8-like Glu-specific endopeptidase